MTERPFHIILFFVDGLGWGDASETNPLMDDRLSILHQGKPHPDFIKTRIDANLDMPGLPQSATGQVSLLSGVNGSQAIGRHKPGYPNHMLRDILRQHSLLKQVTDMGLPAVFFNAFRPPFFTLPEKTKWRLSATTVATLAADLPFFTPEDAARRRTIYHDITNDDLISRGFDVPRLSVEEGAAILARESRQYALTLFEYFLTDMAGHSRNFHRALDEARKLERFLSRLTADLDPERALLIVTSDHGNMEEMAVKSHTRHPVMSLFWGKQAPEISAGIRSILDVTPRIILTLKKAYGTNQQTAQ